MDTLISNRDFGLIFGIGTWVYALSFLVNGPLVDKIGGKKGILIAAFWSGLREYSTGDSHLLCRNAPSHDETGDSILNCLFAETCISRAYGAVSIIKVKAYWFHVRERGVFGAIFWDVDFLRCLFCIRLGPGNRQCDQSWGREFLSVGLD